MYSATVYGNPFSRTIVITQCSIVELYKLGKQEQPSVDIAKSFERRKCNHKEAINGTECIASVVGMFSDLSPSYPLPLFPPFCVSQHRHHHRFRVPFICPHRSVSGP